jgi:hypothetical protein
MATPLINGIAYSWASVRLVLFGVPVTGVTKIDYKAKQTKTNNYGSGIKPVSRGYGNEEYEGSIELYLDQWKAIIAASPSLNPLLIQPFSIQVVFGGTRTAAATDVLQSVEFLEDPLTTSQGDTSIKISIPIIIGGIQHVV